MIEGIELEHVLSVAKNIRVRELCYETANYFLVAFIVEWLNLLEKIGRGS